MCLIFKEFIPYFCRSLYRKYRATLPVMGLIDLFLPQVFFAIIIEGKITRRNFFALTILRVEFGHFYSG
jgi:hypothetical protein